MKNLQNNSINLAFADPPYNIGYSYNEYKDRMKKEDYIKWSDEWITQIYRVLRDDGTFWLAINDENAAELKVLTESIGFTMRSWVIWYYSFGVNCTKKLTRSHTHLLYFVKNPRSFSFIIDDPLNRVPSYRQLHGDKRANPKGRLLDDTWIVPRIAGTHKERRDFPCQMPEEILMRIIRLCSNVGDIVLDPFAGSATTLAVAKKLNRNYIGFELSEEYTKAGIARCDEIPNNI